MYGLFCFAPVCIRNSFSPSHFHQPRCPLFSTPPLLPPFSLYKGVRDAVLLGGSGDVNMWLRPDEEEGGGGGGGLNVEEGQILMARARAGGTRVTLRAGERPLNALVAAFVKSSTGEQEEIMG